MLVVVTVVATGVPGVGNGVAAAAGAAVRASAQTRPTATAATLRSGEGTFMGVLRFVRGTAGAYRLAILRSVPIGDHEWSRSWTRLDARVTAARAIRAYRDGRECRRPVTSAVGGAGPAGSPDVGRLSYPCVQISVSGYDYSIAPVVGNV